MKKLPLLLMGLVFLMACNNATDTQQEAKSEPAQQEAVKPQLTKAVAKEAKPAKVDKANSLVNWMSFEEAQKKVAESPRKIIVDVYTGWCGPCKMMDSYTFNNEEVAAFIDKNFYAVKFNAESGDPVTFKDKVYENPKYDPNRGARRRNAPHQLTQTMGLRGYPTIVVYDPQLNIIQRIVGFKKPEQLMPILNQLAS
ncbi:MAG: thioredoxin fold domain-containing protein [Bacteroidota bacterium]